jgi:hypothetical protein
MKSEMKYLTILPASQIGNINVYSVLRFMLKATKLEIMDGAGCALARWNLSQHKMDRPHTYGMSVHEQQDGASRNGLKGKGSVFFYKNETPWPESESELYRPRDRRLSAKLVPTFADRRCRVVSATDFHCRILGFLDQTVLDMKCNLFSA